VEITHESFAGSQRGGGSITSWVSGLGAQLCRSVLGLVARHRASTELYRCTDWELRDMGLSHGDLPAIINGTYRWPGGF
jgi:uncharacterized protein YjiS (DUF1127 family)